MPTSNLRDSSPLRPCVAWRLLPSFVYAKRARTCVQVRLPRVYGRNCRETCLDRFFDACSAPAPGLLARDGSGRRSGGRSAYPLVVGTIRAALSQGREVGGDAPPEEGGHELTLIGQFAGRCIIAQEAEELIILDQHGAHERILYGNFTEPDVRTCEILRTSP